MIETVLAVAIAIQPVDHQPPICPDRWGEPGARLVSRSETAISIYLAVEQDFFPQADTERFSQIGAEDQGDHWAVWRSAPGVANPDGSITITSGGGQLSMRMAKCDGAISHVFLTR